MDSVIVEDIEIARSSVVVDIGIVVACKDTMACHFDVNLAAGSVEY